MFDFKPEKKEYGERNLGKKIEERIPSEEKLVMQGLEQESRVIELRQARKNIKKFEENDQRKAS